MQNLDVEIRSRLPRMILLILKLSAYLPLEIVLKLRTQTLLDQGKIDDGWVLMGEETHGPVFWLPKSLADEVCKWRWKERRRLPIDKARIKRTEEDMLRMFSRGRWLQHPVTSQEIFGIVARAMRAMS